MRADRATERSRGRPVAHASDRGQEIREDLMTARKMLQSTLWNRNSLARDLAAASGEGRQDHAGTLATQRELVKGHPKPSTIRRPALLRDAGTFCCRSSTGLRSACGMSRLHDNGQALDVDYGGRADRLVHLACDDR